MTDRPIIFSAPMIKALLDGEKTQTRRVIEPCKKDIREGDVIVSWPADAFIRKCLRFHPKHRVGDRLWVKEKYSIVPSTAYRMSEGVQQTVNPNDKDFAAVYAAGWERSKPYWKSPMFMPRWASRITLTVTDVRVQKAHDITGDDAIAEGIETDLLDMCFIARDYTSTDEKWFYTWPNAFNDGGERFCDTADHACIRSYQTLWNSINSKRGYEWETNPWISVIAFDVALKNIDEV
jgi:hypothetical protein